MSSVHTLLKRLPMNLIQIFLPLYDNDGHPFPELYFKDLQKSLTERFGGVTIYQRAPAKGLWKDDTENIVRDDLVIYEVIAEEIDRAYWAVLKTALRKKFRQSEVMVRSTQIEKL